MTNENPRLLDLLDYCQKNNRVCPMPNQWNALYELLPKKQRTDGGWEPSLPLILAAWYDTPHLSKMLRLREHIEWAANHEKIDIISEYLYGLPEDEWLHTGD